MKNQFLTILLLFALSSYAQHTFDNHGLNVGINTLVPTEALEIATGNAKVTQGNLIVGNYNSSTISSMYNTYVSKGMSILSYRPTIRLGLDSDSQWTDLGMAIRNTDFSPISVTGDFILKLGGKPHNKIIFANAGGGDISFTTGAWENNKLRMSLKPNGFLGIGTENPDEMLTVKGTIHTQEVKVNLNGACAPDYVFEKDYKLMPLNELKKFITINKHLPEIPSAKTLDKDGLKLMEMNLLLLKKIEELTLYMLKQQEEIESLKQSLKSRSSVK